MTISRLYWLLRRAWRRSKKDRSFRNLGRALPEWHKQIQQARQKGLSFTGERKRVALFGVLQYWIEQTTLLGAALAGLGHEVHIAYMPYPHAVKDSAEAALQKRDQHILRLLNTLSPFIQPVSWYQLPPASLPENLPEELEASLREIAIRDVQYSLQLEEFDLQNPNSPAGQLYRMRLERDRRTARAAFSWLQENRPQVVLTPNGSVLETAAVYQTARYLHIPVVTYEFGEQRQRIWLAQNAEVMQQETDDLWRVRKDTPLTEAQWDAIRQLYAARQRADLWQNFSRRWQGLPSQGGEKVRQTLNLDQRPLALLTANVIGDSLTLGRQLFTRSMTQWLVETIRFFAGRSDVQLVVRIHPGERYTKGPSVAAVVRQALGDLPQHIHLVPANAPVNTYDLMELADFGLVYTTTAGLEMAMAGVPVIVAGKTHYRQRGFTLDPTDWDSYLDLIRERLSNDQPQPLTEEQVHLAWNYAYRFFFEYPFVFPWRLHFFKQGDLQEWPLSRVLSQPGLERFGNTFRYLSGESIPWSAIPQGEPKAEMEAAPL
ncbi:MAG: hypothetical protein ACOY16_01725 [Chloroflexota bacterium]